MCTLGLPGCRVEGKQKNNKGRKPKKREREKTPQKNWGGEGEKHKKTFGREEGN